MHITNTRDYFITIKLQSQGFRSHLIIVDHITIISRGRERFAGWSKQNILCKGLDSPRFRRLTMIAVADEP